MYVYMDMCMCMYMYVYVYVYISPILQLLKKTCVRQVALDKWLPLHDICGMFGGFLYYKRAPSFKSQMALRARARPREGFSRTGPNRTCVADMVGSPDPNWSRR